MVHQMADEAPDLPGERFASDNGRSQGVTWLTLGTRVRASPTGRAEWVQGMLTALAPWLPAPVGTAVEQGAPIRRGGREAALSAVSIIDPARYAHTRNHLDGAVTRLSPWLRHGVLSTAEVRDRALDLVAKREHAEKLISELAWRDYWQAVYASLGKRIFSDLEPPAATSRHEPLTTIPEDVLKAATGMACIDTFVRQLHSTGFLHNHARMWLASWLIHARGVRWQAGAAWFLSHLLDADPASNTLSWQWVAGTFASKPYIFNRDNLERYTSGCFCQACHLAGHCDLEGSYEDLASAWFTTSSTERPRLKIPPVHAWQPIFGASSEDEDGETTVVWLTLDSLAETSPAAKKAPQAPRVFVIDSAWLQRERPSLLRLQFILECLAEVDRLDLGVGQTAVGIVEAAARHRADRIAVASTPCPFTRQTAEELAAAHTVDVVTGPQLVNPRRVADLGRFSRYWSKVRGSALQHSDATA